MPVSLLAVYRILVSFSFLYGIDFFAIGLLVFMELRYKYSFISLAFSHKHTLTNTREMAATIWILFLFAFAIEKAQPTSSQKISLGSSISATTLPHGFCRRAISPSGSTKKANAQLLGSGYQMELQTRHRSGQPTATTPSLPMPPQSLLRTIYQL